ncbi:MAG: hypothetical protein J0H15_13615 [Xanthomonadales bacterium]|nr:hypothetical protein [Xanthomonadales bacterium]
MMVRSRRWRSVAGLAGAVAVAGWLLLAWLAPRQALPAWLAAWLFFLAIAVGCIPLLLVHGLTGGRWAEDLRPGLLLALRALPMLALLLLPVLLGAEWLFPWADPQTATDPDLARQRWYLNLPFFWLRAIVCIALWLWLAHGLRTRLERAGRISAAFASAGLILYAITITLAAVDWVGSLVPAWHSTVLGMTLGTSQLLAATALAVWLRAVRQEPERRADLGTLLLALLLVWGYLAFMDFLTAWIADLPPEIAWYWPRLRTGWTWLGGALIVIGLVLPFVLLLSSALKRTARGLATAAALVLLGQALFAAWMVLPGVWTPDWRSLAALLLALLGIGAGCAAVALRGHAVLAPGNSPAQATPRTEAAP